MKDSAGFHDENSRTDSRFVIQVFLENIDKVKDQGEENTKTRDSG